MSKEEVKHYKTEDEILEDIRLHTIALRKKWKKEEREKKYQQTIKEVEDCVEVEKNKKIKPHRKDNTYRIFGKSSPNETPIERANRLAEAYKKIDESKGLENNVTGEFILKHIFTSVCQKCGESDWKKLGCDRIDNSRGHLIDNVVCACRMCNIKRNTKLYEDFYS